MIYSAFNNSPKELDTLRIGTRGYRRVVMDVNRRVVTEGTAGQKLSCCQCGLQSCFVGCCLISSDCWLVRDHALALLDQVLSSPQVPVLIQVRVTLSSKRMP